MALKMLIRDLDSWITSSAIQQAIGACESQKGKAFFRGETSRSGSLLSILDGQRAVSGEKHFSMSLDNDARRQERGHSIVTIRAHQIASSDVKVK